MASKAPLVQVLGKEGNQTMTEFFKEKRKDQQKLCGPNNFSQKSTKGTTESDLNSHQQYFERLDLKQFKRLNQLPSINHQCSHQDSAHTRGDSADNLMKLLYSNKTKRLLDPITISDDSNHSRGKTVHLVDQSKKKPARKNTMNHNQIENILEIRKTKRCDSTRSKKRNLTPSHPFNRNLLYFLAQREDAPILILFASLHAARTIQIFLRKRFEMRETMKALIVKRWRLFCMRKLHCAVVEEKV
jgi:hypothetical protein